MNHPCFMKGIEADLGIACQGSWKRFMEFGVGTFQLLFFLATSCMFSCLKSTYLVISTRVLTMISDGGRLFLYFLFQ
ncbi:hypothetical protein SLEP1_g14596 [Rubroshorea leprosula]|uniref:Uncharacterized protein n=1 Tax=Rubroshorea leprosula TaxID=152421 RepID=A0AAV5IJK1_9ROSI|nr:hypothetical protein SLEP1_g14596 [Rubroshorea leprosula]